jgi:hypothetical protein
MNLGEYTEKMCELCAKQADLKASHRDLMDELDEQEKAEIERVRKLYRQRRADFAKSYRADQLAFEREKQQLRMKKDLGEVTAE